MRLFNKYLESFVFIILFERNIFFLLLFRYFCTKDLGFPKEGFEQDKLIEALPTDEGRFIYLDFDYENDDGIRVYKIVSILYCPINAKSKKKMLYSTTFGGLNSQLGGGISTELQCDSPAELSREHILKRVKK